MQTHLVGYTPDAAGEQALASLERVKKQLTRQQPPVPVMVLPRAL